MARRSRTTTRPHGVQMDAIERAAVQAAFLAEFAHCGIILDACRAAGVDRSTITDWRNNDPAFSLAYDAAREDADDIIRAEIFRRGYTGWTETQKVTRVDAAGAQETETRTIRRFDSGLLKMLAQSRMAEFRERLDVTSGDEALGNGEAIAAAATDSAVTALAAQFLSRFAGYGDYGDNTPDASDHAGRPGGDQPD